MPAGIPLDDASEGQSEAFALAIQEAIRASTPKRRTIKLVRARPVQPTQPARAEEVRPVRPAPPPLTVGQILDWADAYHARHGEWPKRDSGRVEGAQRVTWMGVNQALYKGRRGLPGDTTLARLLAEQRGATYYQSPKRAGLSRPLHAPRVPPDLAHFAIAHILATADAWHARHGKWPHADSGPVHEGAGLTWYGVSSALRIGFYGLPGGSSLARLLEAHRGVPNKQALPPLAAEQILEWAGLHKERTGRWPTKGSGAIAGTPGETWSAVDTALRDGNRGLPGGSSLARLFADGRGRRNCKRTPLLAEARILEWADKHHARTGEWPRRNSGTVLDAPGETWGGVSSALSAGIRSLPGGSSLAAFLAKHRGVRNRKKLPHLGKEQILAWADAYRERHGSWPRGNSGPIEGTQGETWMAVDVALYAGQRGLPGDTTLARLLAEHRGAPYARSAAGTRPAGPLHSAQPKPDPGFFTVAHILALAESWHARHGRWPNLNSGPVSDGAEITWTNIDRALRKGSHGLPDGSSLSRLLAAHRDGRD